MSIKLLPAPVNPVDPPEAPDVSASLAPLTQGAITARAGRISLVLSADVFAWSSSTRRGQANPTYGTPVEDSQSDDTSRSGWEQVSGWGRSGLVENTAVAHYLSYAASPASRLGQLIDLYA